MQLSNMQNEENYKIVPWFSRDEWREVYESIFSNSAERWEFAFYKLSVWKARKPDLHIGIESTIPILLAQIAFSDPSLCFPFKNVIIDWAISRFVTITVKGHHSPGMTMRDIAPKINMPVYLIDLRNETSHNDSKFASTLLLQTALNDSLSFIKGSYWDFEDAAYRKELKDSISDSDVQVNEFNSNNVSDNKSEKQTNGCKILIRNIRQLNKLTFKTARLTTFLVKNSNMGGNDIRTYTNQVKAVCSVLMKYLHKNPRSCTQTLVEELFYSTKIKKCIKNKVSLKNKKCKKCVVKIPPQLLSLFSPIIGLILCAGKLELLFEIMLNNFEAFGCPSLCFQWLRSLLNTFTPLKKGSCGYHKFKKGLNKSLLPSVNWKNILFQILSVEKSWSLVLARQLAQNLDIDKDKFSKLCELHSLYTLSKKTTGDTNNIQDDNKMDSYLSPDNIRDLDNLLTEALKVSTDVHSYVEELVNCLPPKNSKSLGIRKIKSSEFTPLGLLPHQKGDSGFFQKLKLTSNLSKPSLLSHLNKII